MYNFCSNIFHIIEVILIRWMYGYNRLHAQIPSEVHQIIDIILNLILSYHESLAQQHTGYGPKIPIRCELCQYIDKLFEIQLFSRFCFAFSVMGVNFNWIQYVDENLEYFVKFSILGRKNNYFIRWTIKRCIQSWHTNGRKCPMASNGRKWTWNPCIF